MVYETARVIADLLDGSGLFKQIFIHGGPIAKAAEEIVREPGVAVVYTGEGGSLSGCSITRELVFSVVLKTMTLGKGENTLKAAGNALDGMFSALQGLPLASWRVADIGSNGRESLFRIDFSYRFKG